MKYTLRVDYITGDSLNTENRISDLEIEWTDLNILKQNLRDIVEHYYMVKELDKFQNRNRFDEILNEYKIKDWFDGQDCQDCLYLKADNGNKIKISAFWIGSFEELHNISIIMIGDDLVFKP